MDTRLAIFFKYPMRIVRISSQLEVDGPGVMSYPVKTKKYVNKLINKVQSKENQIFFDMFI